MAFDKPKRGRYVRLPMALRSLRLRDFRCFPSLSCALAPGETLFVGENAQGKTSLLEAVCVLLRLQSPRTSAPKELVRFSAPGFGVAGTMDDRELTHTLTDGVKSLKVDGEPVRRTADYLAAGGLVVWMGNGDLELVTGGGEGRRRYLDFLGGQLFPEYRPALKSFEKALRSRNFLLKREAAPPWRQIDAYTEVLAVHAAALTRLRAELVERLTPRAAEACRAISGRDEIFTLTWRAGGEDDLPAQLLRLRPEEERRRVTAAGPHRDDVELALNGLPAAAFASEGQQRTLALALKLAQATVLTALAGRGPLLLLDDIFGELDPLRRNALLAALPADSQKLITTTHLDWLRDAPAPGAVIEVRDGALFPR